MKGRSHRLQSADPHEDWVDGSWTVDCVCGVNFDDGEEMVNCDECGVWVHTRCSRYVKGDELFTCDKCKNKNNRNDSEETEVAQLLVELPTKTLRMESSYAANAPAQAPLRLWADIPMEEKVHVQGIPGGDPVLFAGLSTVFTRELWKCRGYVPKKFNFQYREFPCWDDNEKDQVKNSDENRNQVDNGAGVLFLLSKDSHMNAPMTGLVGISDRDEEAVYGKKEDAKKWEGEEVDIGHWQNGEEDRSLLHPDMAHSNKRKKEESGTSRDRSSKKKARVADKVTDEKKRNTHASKAVSKPSGDAKQLEFSGDRDSEAVKTEIQSKKSSRDSVPCDHLPENTLTSNNSDEKVNRKSMAIVNSMEPAPFNDSECDPTIGVRPEVGEPECLVPGGTKSSPEANVASLPDKMDSESCPVKEKGDSIGGDRLDGSLEGSERSVIKHSIDGIAGSAPEDASKQIQEDFNGDSGSGCKQSDVEVKLERDRDSSRGVLYSQSSPSVDAGHSVLAVDHMSETSKINNSAAGSLQSSDQKVQGLDRISEAVNNCHTDKADQLSSDPCRPKREVEGSEGSALVQKGSSDSKHGSELLEESLKPNDAQHSDQSSKERLMSDSSASSKKEHKNDVRDGDRQKFARKSLKEHPKSSVSAKVSHQSRVSHTYVSKRTVSDSKDSVPPSTSKTSSMQNTGVTSISGDAAGSFQNQCSSQVQNRTSSSGVPRKGEKPGYPNFQPSKNHAQSVHPPVPSNSSTTLSDEELALLLHQELNSSPRVPRVPRVRNAGSLPQLASSTAMSTLTKRTSSSGGKDHGLVSRRKNKDASKDGVLSSSELDDEAKKTNKVPSSPDLRRLDNGLIAEASSKREETEVPPVHAIKKNMLPSSATTSNGPSSSNEANDNNFSSIRNSPRHMSDDDLGTVRSPLHRTLPGLINEILMKNHGRRMSHEELFDAVLPHWPNLRKHNGERYAYSSHSQAVLDCLRNRQEWARLVDRGPKTNSTRKRRKLDAEESEGNDYSKGKTTKEVETKSLNAQREDFPKGKRNARKRRHLVLQGRRIKDMAKRRRTESTEEDSGPFSDSSEESMFSEDEIQDGGA
ncbi:uncharacterized protein LOC110816440 isoform X2 [Carica papaya]|uniref:uncharacterized protein LOC110816440 isoform X2 n=1 Tax=Carica papaya TaxID=3649 RepID=UPI000B8C8816|nr:uncharacterized protein LOC110816440 isoform X2 [Carica papaya]